MCFVFAGSCRVAAMDSSKKCDGAAPASKGLHVSPRVCGKSHKKKKAPVLFSSSIPVLPSLTYLEKQSGLCGDHNVFIGDLDKLLEKRLKEVDWWDEMDKAAREEKQKKKKELEEDMNSDKFVKNFQKKGVEKINFKIYHDPDGE